MIGAGRKGRTMVAFSPPCFMPRLIPLVFLMVVAVGCDSADGTSPDDDGMDVTVGVPGLFTVRTSYGPSETRADITVAPPECGAYVYVVVVSEQGETGGDLTFSYASDEPPQVGMRTFDLATDLASAGLLYTGRLPGSPGPEDTYYEGERVVLTITEASDARLVGSVDFEGQGGDVEATVRARFNVRPTLLTCQD